METIIIQINYYYLTYFKGDEKKVPFVLFENDKDELIKQKIKKGVEKMKNESDDSKKRKIEDEIAEELSKELKNFEPKNFKFKNGKYFAYQFYSINDNILEEFYSEEKKKKLYEGEFIQKNEVDEFGNWEIYLLRHGKGKSWEHDNYPGIESEFFYDYRIGRGKELGNKNDKFFLDLRCGCGFYKEETKENISFYTLDTDCYINNIKLEINNQKKNCGTIFIKDNDGQKIIYEIHVNINNNYDIDFVRTKDIEGMGIVKDFRNGDILIVNFNSNNIITDNLKDLPIFVDKEEFDIYKDDFEEERNKNNNNEQTKEIQTNSNLNSNNLN